MKFLLLSLALVSAAFADGDADPDVEEIRALLVNANVTAEAIEEFFASKLNVLPFTTETYTAYTAWKTKWNVDIRELEIRSNEALMASVQKEVAHRTAEFIKHLEERVTILEELATKGQLSEENKAKENALDEAASTFELKLVNRVSEEMMAAVGKEWGVTMFDGQEEQEEQAPEPQGDEQTGENGEDKEEEKETEKKEETTEGEKEETKGDEEAKKEAEKPE